MRCWIKISRGGYGEDLQIRKQILTWIGNKSFLKFLIRKIPVSGISFDHALGVALVLNIQFRL